MSQPLGGQSPATTSVAETPTLVSFSVFNPNISHGEDDTHENILWFHPAEQNMGSQLRTVGLCTAFTTLSNTFGADALRHSSTDRHRFVAEQMEPDFWFLVVFKRIAAADIGLEDRDDCLVTGIRTILRRCYAVLNITMGSMGTAMAREAAAVREEDDAEVAASTEGRRRMKERFVAVHAARRLAKRIAPMCREFSVAIHNLVTSPRSSFAVRGGLDYVTVNVEGHLQLGSFTRRLHNAHPGTIAHSVLIVQPNYLAFSTLSNEVTSTLLNFVHAAEGRHRDSIVPQAVFVDHRGKPIVLRGKDAVTYCNAVNALSASRMPGSAAPSAAGVAESIMAGTAARDWMKKVAARFGGGDTPSSQRVAAAIEATKETAQDAVVAHDARTQCYINDVLMGVMCFTQGPFSLYCLVEDKFCQHDLLRQGLIESVAAILLEERAMLRGASSISLQLAAPLGDLEKQVMYAYRNMAINASKMSPHFKKDDNCVGRVADTAIALDRLRDAAFDAVSEVEGTSSMAARLHDSVWGFAEKYGRRDFTFALTGDRAKAGMVAAFAQANEVRETCLKGLHID